MRGLVSRYGLRSTAYLAVGVSRPHLANPYLAVTYSTEWVDHYKRQRYVEIDPVVHMGMRRLLPLDWDEFGRPEGALKTFFGEASEFGLGHRGLTIPVHGRGSDRGLFTITSDVSERVWRRDKLEFLRDFQVIAVSLHEKVLELEGLAVSRPRLSPRELECLHWASEGKTAWASAVILGLSEHTVRCYLESTRYKLNACSNMHAVSIAHRWGLFDPQL